MRRILFCIFILFISLFIFKFNVYAECSNAQKISLNKLASPVSAEYSLRKENGSYVFNFLIYNISNNNIYVYYHTSGDSLEVASIKYSDTNSGTYNFTDTNVDSITTYNFEVRSNLNECKDQVLKRFTVVKPKRNRFFEYEQCKYESLQDYYYCKEWITRDFMLDDEKIVEELNKEVESKKEQESEKNDVENKNELSESTKKIIKIIIAAITVIVILIAIQIYRIKRYEI